MSSSCAFASISEHGRRFHLAVKHQLHNCGCLQLLPYGNNSLRTFSRLKVLGNALRMSHAQREFARSCPRARTINALKSGFAGVFLPSFLEAHLADFAK